MHTTKIVCTLGPASESRKTVATLADADMSLARFNASHGSTDERAALIERVRDVDATTEASVATLLDLPVPEIRTAPHEESISRRARRSISSQRVSFGAPTTSTP